MEIRDLSDWPFAVRCLVTYGQQLANARVHAETSGAHVLSGLMTMTPIRRLLGEPVTAEIDKACAKALLVSRKGGASTAILTQPLALILVGTPAAPANAPRTTASFVSSFLGGAMFLEKAHATMKARAEDIARVLDAPRVEEMLTKYATPEVKALSSSLFVGFAAATELQHREITTRHVLYGALMIIDRALAKGGKDTIPEPLGRLKDLLERTTPKRDPKQGTIAFQSRLYGAVAGTCAEAQAPDEIEAKLVTACLEGDPEVGFVRETIAAAREHLAAE